MSTSRANVDSRSAAVGTKRESPASTNTLSSSGPGTGGSGHASTLIASAVTPPLGATAGTAIVRLGAASSTDDW